MYALTITIILFTIVSSSPLRNSTATDAITQGQPLNYSQTIVSASGIYELGFFVLGANEGSTNKNNFYLGIWYKMSPKKTIVWVANRDRPIRSKSNFSCSLTTNQDGNLVILSGETGEAPVPLTSISPANNNTCATLLDTGNFVLKDNCSTNSSNDVFLWQSFDHPTDTFLPGMKVGYNFKTGKTWQFTSWKSFQDPSPGIFSVILDRETTSQILVMNGSRRLWTTGPWNGQSFSFIPELDNITYKFEYITNANERYFHISGLSNSILTRIVIDVYGKIQQYGWVENFQDWISLWEQPKELCDVYRYCGANSNCDRSTRAPYCNCLQGFRPSNQKEWNLKDWSRGCARRTALQCGDEDKFVVMSNMSLPLEPKSVPVKSDEACKLYCLQICSCTAYAYMNKQCSIWFNSLYNVRKADFSGADLSMRLAASEFKILEDSRNKPSSASEHSRHRTITLVLVLSIPALVITLSSITYCLWTRKQRQRGKMNIDQDLMLFDFNNKTKKKSDSSSNTSNIVSGGTWDIVELPSFSFASVSTATNNFSDENKLGQGGFGPVYKGTLSNGHEVAVKRLSRSSCQGLEELKNEATLIAKLQHRNLVRLLGCCIEGEEKILIYEYMANKSLDLFLFDHKNEVKLTWKRRVDIIEGIAQGLLYLHQHSRLRIIHRDLKASNILLDDKMNPKISDFGMARIFGDYKSEANTNRIVGTYGYMSPEYAMGGIFSIKSDVFSFGVLLLEILSGIKNSSFHLSNNNNPLNLIGHAWHLWVCERQLELVDSILLGESTCLSPTPIKFIHVALLCLQEKPTDRPTMSEVIAMIANDSMNLPPLKQPAFSFGNYTEGSSTRSSQQQACSVNDLTLSLHAR